MVRLLLALMLSLGLAAVAQQAVALGELADGGSGSASQADLPAADDGSDNQADEDNKQSDDEPSSDDSAKDSDASSDESADDAPSSDDDKPTDEKADKQAEDKPAEAKEDQQAEKASSDDKQADKQGDKKDGAEEPKAEEKAKADKPAEKKKPETHKVERKDLKVEVEADAVFVAEEAEEVALRPETWSSFKVVEAVSHGARVHKGDVLVKFDDKDIDKELEEKALALRVGEIALLEAEEEFPRLEKSIELNYQDAQRTYEQAVDEQTRFNKTMRSLSERMAQYMLKSAEQDYENASEELKQLQKMYEADELTEETEEIVLKRQKFQVEAAKFFLEYSKVNHEYTTTVSIPRRAESLKTAVAAAKIEFERAKMAKSLGMNEQRYQLQQLREARAKSLENYADLEADRQLMELKAPIDGIAYYGRCVNGRWIEVGSQESKLIPFGSATPNSVVMTVVKERPMYVETSVGEKELPTLEDGQSAIVVPTADSDVEIAGKVEQAADVPGSSNKFTVRVDVDGAEAPDWLMPGMTGKAKITTYSVEDAVVIPADLVQSDEDEPKNKYVMVLVEDEPMRRDVKLGKTKDKEVEVLKGLKEGDEIVKGAKDKSADKQADADKSDEKSKPSDEKSESEAK